MVEHSAYIFRAEVKAKAVSSSETMVTLFSIPHGVRTQEITVTTF
jgi:hypothetical protein